MPRLGRLLSQGSGEAILELQLVLSIVEIVIFFVQTVIRQVRKDIVGVALLVWLGSQPNQAIVEQEDRRLLNNRQEQNINSEVELVPPQECWLGEVFLDHVRRVLVANFGRQLVRVFLLRFKAFFLLQILVEFLELTLETEVHLAPQLLH